jgi:choice-of-anchor C domain-containing protein
VPLGEQEEDFSPVNLLVNGSFEEGLAIDPFGSLDEGSTDLPGWTVTRGQIDSVGSYWAAAEGRRSLDLNGSPGCGGVQQTFRTRAGQRYRVTFALAGNPEREGQGVVRLAVSAAGAVQEFEFDTTGKTLDDPGWVDASWEFTASEEKTTLEIYSLETTDLDRGPALDDVRVVAVPGGD